MQQAQRFIIRVLLLPSVVAVITFASGPSFSVFAASVHSQVACTWRVTGSSGSQTVYIYDAINEYTYGYTISAVLHTDFCGDAYATGTFSSNDAGAPGGTAAIILYRVTNCDTGANVHSQETDYGYGSGPVALSLGPTVENSGQTCDFAAVQFTTRSGSNGTVSYWARGSIVQTGENE